MTATGSLVFSCVKGIMKGTASWDCFELIEFNAHKILSLRLGTACMCTHQLFFKKIINCVFDNV